MSFPFAPSPFGFEGGYDEPLIIDTRAFAPLPDYASASTSMQQHLAQQYAANMVYGQANIAHAVQHGAYPVHGGVSGAYSMLSPYANQNEDPTKPYLNTSAPTAPAARRSNVYDTVTPSVMEIDGKIMYLHDDENYREYPPRTTANINGKTMYLHDDESYRDYPPPIPSHPFTMVNGRKIYKEYDV